MAEVTTTEASGKVTVTSFEYDATGIRIASTHKIDANGDGTFESHVHTENLVDHHNFTGYQQSIKETHTDLLTGKIIKTIEYTYGHDEIAQTTTEYDPSSGLPSTVSTLTFGHDGHGSVRVLYDSAASILQLFAYSSYGEMLGIHDGQASFLSTEEAVALTILLYSGEPYYQQIAMQYLRIRWYNAETGRFNRDDPFAGNMQDPQSLHKYLYVHGDPVNGIDPTGLSLTGNALAGIGISGLIGTFAGASLFGANGRSAGYGAVTGFVGGASIATAYYTGRFGPVFGEAAFSGLLAMSLSALIDYANGDNLDAHLGEYFTNGFEAFSWSAFFAQWFTGSDLAGDDPLALSHAIGNIWVEDMQILTQLSGVFIGAFADVITFGLKEVTVGLTPAEEQAFRSSLKDSTSNVLDIAFGALPSLIIAGTAGSVFGLRGMPSRLKGDLLQGVLDAAGFGAGGCGRCDCR